MNGKLRSFVLLSLCMLTYYISTYSSEPQHFLNTISILAPSPTPLPITALSRQGALDFAKAYVSTYPSDSVINDSFSCDIHSAPLCFESHTNTMHISGSTDPLSMIYLVRDSPKILAGLFDGAIKGFQYIFDTTGKHKHRKEAQATEEYLYKIDQDRALIYHSLSYEEAIKQDLIYLEKHIQELSVATYTMTVPHGCYTVYYNLEDTLRDAYRTLIQQHPRPQATQLEAALHSAQYGLNCVRKTKFKDKKFKKETIAQYTDRVAKAKTNLHQFQQEQVQKQTVEQHLRDMQAAFDREHENLFSYCIEQQEFVLYWHDADSIWYERNAARIEALDDVARQPSTNRYHTLSAHALSDLQSYHLDTTLVQNCTGNAYQQQLHDELVDIIETTTGLEWSTDASYKEALLTCSVSACVYNQNGESLTATKITDFCWAFLDYGSAIAEGVGLGLCSALLHVITHPVETTLYAVIGPYMAAYQLSMVAYSVLDIGITAAYDPEIAHEKWDDFIQPVTDIYAALTDREFTARDAIKTGAALATHLYAQTKLICGLQKLCKGILQEVGTWANSKLQAPKDLLASSEGPLFQQSSNDSRLDAQKNVPSKINRYLSLSAEQLDEAFKLATHENSLEHFFKQKHKLTDLVAILNGEKNVVRAVLVAANGKLPLDGLFKDLPVQVEGFTIYIRGRVINGIPRLGTMFIQ